MVLKFHCVVVVCFTVIDTIKNYMEIIPRDSPCRYNFKSFLAGYDQGHYWIVNS